MLSRLFKLERKCKQCDPPLFIFIRYFSKQVEAIFNADIIGSLLTKLDHFKIKLNSWHELNRNCFFLNTTIVCSRAHDLLCFGVIEFCVVMPATISVLKQCSVRLYLQLFFLFTLFVFVCA